MPNPYMELEHCRKRDRDRNRRHAMQVHDSARKLALIKREKIRREA